MRWEEGGKGGQGEGRLRRRHNITPTIPVRDPPRQKLPCQRWLRGSDSANVSLCFFLGLVFENTCRALVVVPPFACEGDDGWKNQ